MSDRHPRWMTDFWAEKKTTSWLGSGQSTWHEVSWHKISESEKAAKQNNFSLGLGSLQPDLSNLRISMFFNYKNSASETSAWLGPGYSEVGAVKANWLAGAGFATSEGSIFSIPGMVKPTESQNPWLIFHWKSWLVHSDPYLMTFLCNPHVTG